MFSKIMQGIGKAFFVITYSAILGFFTFLGYLLFSGFKCVQMQSKPNTDQGNENLSVNFDQCSSTLAVSVAALTIAGVSLYYSKNCYQMTKKQCLKFRNRDSGDNTATPNAWHESSCGSSRQILPDGCRDQDSNPNLRSLGTDSESDDEERQSFIKKVKQRKKHCCQIS